VQGVQLSSQPLGTLDGKTVTVYVQWYGDDPNNPQPASSTDVSILLESTTEGKEPESFNTIFSTQLEVDVPADALSGVIHFTGLASTPAEAPGAAPSPEVISGTVSWDCR
jgi:hypothetical protein